MIAIHVVFIICWGVSGLIPTRSSEAEDGRNSTEQRGENQNGVNKYETVQNVTEPHDVHELGEYVYAVNLTKTFIPQREKPIASSETLTFTCEALMRMLIRMNYSTVNFPCPNKNDTESLTISSRLLHLKTLRRDPYIDHLKKIGRQVYAYTTPVIIAVGVIGNVISLCVFLSKTLRKQAACYYLMTLSATDLVVLLVYVLFEWLERGLPYIVGNSNASLLQYSGVCYIFLYLSYCSRFLSAWLIVIFTVERYIGVCKPLQRREMCTRSFARKMIASLVVISLLLCIWKPAMSGTMRMGRSIICGALLKHKFSSFVLDAIFAIVTTLVPFIVISFLNFLIIRRLFLRNRMQKLTKMASRDHMIRVEITLILLVISSCFIAVTIPYFVTWLCTFLTSKCFSFAFGSRSRYWYVEYLRGIRYITKTIYFLNYSMNFFLYSLTGASFRREMKYLFRPGLRRKVSLRTSAFSRTQSLTPVTRV